MQVSYRCTIAYLLSGPPLLAACTHTTLPNVSCAWQLLDEAEPYSVKGREVQLSGKPQPLAHAANAIVLKLLAASGCMPQPATPSAGLCTWSYLHPKTVCLHAQPQHSRSS